MKVCIATEFYPVSAVSNVVEELSRQGVEVVVFTSQHDLSGRQRGPKKVDAGKVTSYFTPSIYLPRIPYAFVPFALRDFVSVIRKEKVDVIHAQVFAFYTIPNTTPIIKKICTKPLVLTFHGLQHAFVNPFYSIGMFAYYKTYFRFITKEAEKVIVLSKLSEKKAIRLGTNFTKIVVLPNGVDIHRFYPSTAPYIRKGIKGVNVRVVYVGRISAGKGVFILLQAAKKLFEKYGDRILFLLAGDGPDMAALRNIVQSEKLANVKLLGNVRNVRELLINSDIFVLPSFYEGLPLSLMEAMACKVPVVASKVGDVPALITHSQNGILIPPRDVVSLMHAIEELVENPDFAQKLAENGYETIKKNYNVEKIAKQLKEIYESLRI